MKIGYARVSSKDQNLDRQIEAFKTEGVDKVFSEKVSGKSTDGRIELQKAMDFAREGDVFVILSFDRLARSLHDLLTINNILQTKGVALKSLHEDIDLSGPTGKLMLSVFGAFAEFERNIINERRREGIEAAKAQGKKIGRPTTAIPKNWAEVIATWQSGGISAVEAMKTLGLSKPTFYRLVKKNGIVYQRTK